MSVVGGAVLESLHKDIVAPTVYPYSVSEYFQQPGGSRRRRKMAVPHFAGVVVRNQTFCEKNLC